MRNTATNNASRIPWGRKALAIVASFFMVMSLVVLPSPVAAEDGDTATGTDELGAPTVSKDVVRDSDGNPLRNADGSYTLRLSVTGKSKHQSESTKADVIVVFDVSGSMNNTQGDSTRVEEAKSAVEGLASSLLPETGSSDAVNMALVTFSTNATVSQQLTGSRSAFNNTVEGIGNSIDVQGGTNWEAALKAAQDIQTREGAQKYIIFVSDGNPTYRDSVIDTTDLPYTDNSGWYVRLHRYYSQSERYWLDDNNNHYMYINGTMYSASEDWRTYYSNDVYTYAADDSSSGYYIFTSDYYYDQYKDDQRESGVYGLGADSNSYINYSLTSMRRCYTAALNEWNTLKNTGYSLYSVGVFGNAGWMKSLAAGLSDPTQGDSITDPSNYFSADDQTALNNAFSQIVREINQDYSYKNVSIEDTLSSAVTGTGVDGEVTGFKYYKNNADGTLTEWSDAPTASYAGGKVTWDLSQVNGSDYELEDGVTYTVEFNVVLTQEDYDNAARIKNGGSSSDSNVYSSDLSNVTTADVLAYTNAKDSDTVHSRVNYTQFMKENGVEVSGSESTGHVSLDSPSVPVPTSDLTIKKNWNGEGTKSTISIDVLQDGEAYKADGRDSYTVSLNADNNWSQKIIVPAGPDGHTYSIKESTNPSGWKLNGYSFDEGTTAASADSGNTYKQTWDAATDHKLAVTNVPDVYGFRIHKYVGDNEDRGENLAGATFTLTPANDDWTAKSDSKSTSVTTDNDGLADFSNLLPGKYIVKETHVPTGYQNLDGERYLEISQITGNDGVVATSATWGSKNAAGTVDSTEITSTLNKDGTTYFKVAIGNAAIPDLPTTGGIGVWPLLGGGAVLVAAGVAIVVLRRRTN